MQLLQQNLKKKRISSMDLITFFRQLATLISSNISIIQAMHILHQSQPNLFFKKIILDIKHLIEKGNHLSWCLKQFPLYFDNMTCNLLSIGEHSGTFSIMLQHIALHKEKSYHFKNKIKQSLFYPALITIVAIGISLVMLFFIVPQFSHLFEEMHAPLPLLTLVVLHFSEFLKHYIFFILLPFIVILFTDSLIPLKNLILKFPFVRSIIHKILLINFTHLLALTLKSGLPISESISLITETYQNVPFKKELFDLKKMIEKGYPLHYGLKNNPRFPSILVEMVRIGEETGTLDYMLEKTCTLFENDLSQQLSYLSDLLEPLIMIVLGVLIGGLVIAMYLPIFKLGTIV